MTAEFERLVGTARMPMTTRLHIEAFASLVWDIAQEKALTWTPVGERLPPNERMVLIMYRSAPRNDKSGRRSQHLARYAGSQWRFLVPRDQTKLPERVTHWMPLPRYPDA